MLATEDARYQLPPAHARAIPLLLPSLVLLLGAARSRNHTEAAHHLPTSGVAPRLGTLEQRAAELPEFGSPREFYTHYRRDDQLLVRVGIPGSDALVVVDASARTATMYCLGSEDAFPGPMRAQWASELGFWDVVEGRLHLITTSGMVASCAQEEAPVTRPEPLNSLPGSSIMVDGGYVTWREGSSATLWPTHDRTVFRVDAREALQ